VRDVVRACLKGDSGKWVVGERGREGVREREREREKEKEKEKERERERGNEG
jgi:hypothetical protein